MRSENQYKARERVTTSKLRITRFSTSVRDLRPFRFEIFLRLIHYQKWCILRYMKKAISKKKKAVSAKSSKKVAKVSARKEVSLKKPTLTTENIQYLDYHDCCYYLEKKYGVDYHDWAKSGFHFNKWADAKGYEKKDSEGKDRSSSQVWFAEYKKDPKGMKARPPSQNFWHFLLDIHEIRKGVVVTLNMKVDSDSIKENWQKEAYLLLHNEFADKNGNMPFLMNW